MKQRCQLCVTILLTCWVLEAAVSVTFQVPPTYYWSRRRTGSFQVSHRAHIGPLPHVNHIMTEWSPWSSWARCSRSCGGGVRSRTRTCVTSFPRVMPGSGVRTSHDQCGGESVQYGVCGSGACPPGQVSALSLRAAQCRHYNNRRVFGRLVNNWVPYTQGGINPCALVCEGEGEGIIYTFGKVSDGTHCKSHPWSDGLCVNGRCLRLSCDGRLGGRSREDMCRVCGGRNDTCTHHVGVYHTDLPAADQPTPAAQTRAARTRTYGYYEVTRIPAGATNVRVSDSSANFLALKAGMKFMLNGDWLIDWPGEVDAGGATFTYTRAEDDSETLASLGPTTHDLTLMVLLREHNPGIHYEYWTPNSPPSPKTSLLMIITPPPTASVTSATTTNTTTTSTNISTPTTTTTTTSRPAILTSVGITRLHRLPLGSPPSSVAPPPFDNSTHTTPPRPREPSKARGQGGRKGRKQKGHRGKKEKKRKGKKGKAEQRGKVELQEGERCEPCERPRRHTKRLFCTSDFVSRVEVMSSLAVGAEHRYEVLVHQSYKNTVPLLHKEFLWVTNACLCPRLRQGHSYLVMGVTEISRGREVRLVLGRESYVRRYKPRHLARILRIRHNEMRFCRPWRRDLRFLREVALAPNTTLPTPT
ncbi:ADAMTS-like protein 5 isoform X1 [Panulirus ornatus]|uniref:ADAMTS-like protein 5 isoform X1 n=1 Tax=Panulirus ornatus TaxID=150431 RepID=UPI003A84BD62